MTLEQLKIFSTVAKHLHVTRAAEELGLTQSGASAAIAALEARYGVELFHRVGRRIELTETGLMFMISAQKVLGEVADAERTLSELSSLQCGTLSVYASQTVSNYWLPARVGEFRGRYPGIKLKVTIGNTEQVVSAVMDGSADLGFVEGCVDHPVIDQTELTGDQLVLLFPTGRSASRYDARNLAEFREIPWVLREEGSGTRQIFEDALKRQGIDPRSLNVVLELPSNEAVLTAVEAGIGATVISRLVADRSRLRSVDIGLAPRVFRALRHRERFFGEAQRTMLAIAGRAPDNIVAHGSSSQSKRGVA